jgi:antitoxin VapB
MYIDVALHLTDPETDRLARELAHETGETLTEAVNRAVKERLGRKNETAGSRRETLRRNQENSGHGQP